MGWDMTAFIWFWIIVALVIVFGMIFWAVFFRGSPPKKKQNKLDEILFRNK